MLNPKDVLPGKEQYEYFKDRMTHKRRCQYDYRAEDGELFSCIQLSLESCRRARDKWMAATGRQVGVLLAENNKFKLWMGCLGNGTSVCNKAVEEYGDYKKIAHISEEGEIKWYVDDTYTPPDAVEKIKAYAAKQKSKYEKWWKSLSEEKRYELTLDKMTASELVEHIRKKREEKKNEVLH